MNRVHSSGQDPVVIPGEQAETPVVGEALTAESVKLLREGDWLRVGRKCSVGPSIGEAVRFHHADDSVWLGSFDPVRDGWLPNRFTFLGRPDPTGWIENPGFNPAPGMRVDVRWRDESFSEYRSDDLGEYWHIGPESMTMRRITAWRPTAAPATQQAAQPDAEQVGIGAADELQNPPTKGQDRAVADLVEALRTAFVQGYEDGYADNGAGHEPDPYPSWDAHRDTLSRAEASQPVGPRGESISGQDGWIEWAGGVTDDAPVEGPIRWRNRRGDSEWFHDAKRVTGWRKGHRYQIVAYRPDAAIPAAPTAPTTAED